MWFAGKGRDKGAQEGKKKGKGKKDTPYVRVRAMPLLSQ
jgi:hypothetical protein